MKLIVLLLLWSSVVMPGLVHAGNPATSIGRSDICSDATIIDFESGSTGLPTVAGLTFVETATNQPNWFQGSASFFDRPPFGGNFGEQVYANVSSVMYSDLAVEFSPPIGAAGGYIGSVGARNPAFVLPNPTEIEIRAFSATGELVFNAVRSLPQIGGTASFVGVAYDEGIARMEWRGGNAGFFGVDNLTFGRACLPVTAGPVPVPANGDTWIALVTLLTAAVGGYQFKRCRKGRLRATQRGRVRIKMRTVVAFR